MKRALLVLAMVLSMVVGTAFACDPVPTASATATATIEKGAITNNNDNRNTNTNLNTNSNLNTNTNLNTNINSNVQGQLQGQVQGQKQGQKQSQNNNQSIAPVQQTVVTTPQGLLALPSQSVPELNFGNGRMKDVTKELPTFAIYGIRALGTEEMILKVIKVDANVKFKNLYKSILKDGATVAKNSKGTIMIRYQVIRAESQKTMAFGGNMGGGGSGLASGGLAGGSGVGAIVPQIGRTKADDLFTIIYVRVSL